MHGPKRRCKEENKKVNFLAKKKKKRTSNEGLSRTRRLMLDLATTVAARSPSVSRAISVHNRTTTTPRTASETFGSMKR